MAHLHMLVITEKFLHVHAQQMHFSRQQGTQINSKQHVTQDCVVSRTCMIIFMKNTHHGEMNTTHARHNKTQ